ncbi:MAG: hypothetical protein IJT94_04975, partial [Oscillibacter sp.]|nr:hypothetical protein [Oscillibacter sp.]
AGNPLSLGKTIAGNLRNELTGTYRDIDPNDPAYAMTAAASAQGEGAERALQDNVVLSVMRGGAVSAAQNLALLWLGGGASAAGAQGFVLGGMAVNAGGQTAYENLREGKTAGRALLNALVDAGIETGTEMANVDRWFQVLNQFDPRMVGSSMKQLLKQLPAQMLSEGMEEVIGNEAGQLWDMLSQGNQSEYARRVENLVSSGMSRKDAEAEATTELHVYRDARAFAEAAFSVLLMDGAPVSIQAVQQDSTFARTGRGLRVHGGNQAITNTIQKGMTFSEDSQAHAAAVKLAEQWKDGQGSISNRDLGRQAFLNANAFADLAQSVEQRGDAMARAKLREVYSRLDADIYDKVALSDLRGLAEFARNQVPTFEEFWSQRRTEFTDGQTASMPEIREQLSRLDLDGNGAPLVSYREAVEIIKERFPAATNSEVQDIYRQYRNDSRIVLFGGHRLTLSEFTDLMRLSTDGDQLTQKEISGLFNQAILDTLDGTDAFERYVQPETAQTAPESAAAPEAEREQGEYDDLPFTFGDYYGSEEQSPNAAKIERETPENAGQSAKRAEMRSDTQTGAKPGLVRDAWTEENLTRRTAAELDDTARLLGRTVRFAESIREGTAQGQYQDGEIRIAQDAEDPVAFVYGHEIGHSLEEAAPEEYWRFVDAVAPEIEDVAEVIREQYRQQGVERTRQEALGEAANNYIGSLVNNTDTLRRFIDRHTEQKSMLGKLRDAVRWLWNKLRGVKSENVRKLQTASDLLDAALDAGAKAVREGNEQKNAATKDGGEKFSLKKMADGTKFVDVDIDQDLFDGLTVNEMQTLAKREIVSRFKGKVIGTEYTAFVKKDSAEHYAYPANRRMDLQQKEDKMRASPELDHIMEASVYRENVPDDGRHPAATGGLDKLDVKFRVNGRMYDAEITVLVTNRGRVFYDMTKFKDITGREIGQTHNSAAETSGNVLNDSIADSGPESKENFSLKGTGMAAMEAGEIRREARDADQTVSDLMRNMGPPVPRRTSTDQRVTQAERQAAQREQQALKQELETYWTEQSKRTEKFTIRQDDVDKLARKLVREFGGAYDAAEISSELKSAAETLLDVSSPEMTVEQVYNTVRPTARKLVENALEKVSRDDAEDRQEMEKQAFTWVEQKEKKYEELARKKIEQEKQRREREAQKLRESVSQQRAALREQLRRTTDPKANRESANRLARKLVQEYDSLAKPGEIGKTIAEAAEYVWRTAQGQEEFSSDALRDILEPAARELVENAAALVNAEQDKDWQDIRPMIQGRFSIPRSVSDTWQDLGQWNRDNKGRMSAGVDESGRRSADSAYEELSKRWPQYFPKEATDTRERLEIMSAAWDQLQPTWENPHNANLDAAAESAVTDMVKRIFNLRRADVRNADKTNRDDAYYTAVAQAYNRVIEETQPNYTTMQ